MGRILPALLGLAVLAAPTGAQARVPTFITVVGEDGQPLARAEVTCVCTPDFVAPWPRDLVTVATNERGRARCDLVVGRIYTAWAVGPADEHGARAATDVVPLVAAGRVLELHAGELRAPREVRLAGHAAWRTAGATGLRWYPDAREGVAIDLPWPDGDCITLPPSPLTDGSLVLTDAGGEPLVATQVQEFVTEAPPFAAPIAIRLYVGAGFATPVAGARVHCPIARASRPFLVFDPWQTNRRLHRDIGTTDAEGLVRFHVPPAATAAASGTSPVFVSKPGFAPELLGIKEAGPTATQLTARAPTIVQALGDGRERMQLAAIASDSLRTSPSSSLLLASLLRSEVREPGRWSVQGGVQGFTPRLLLAAKVPTAIVSDPIAADATEATLDIGRLRAIDVSVVDAGGGPIACAVGIARQVETHPQWEAVCATDAAGRASLRLPEGPFVALATTGNEHALALIEPAGANAVRLCLAPLPSMKIRIRNAAGMPVTGARVEFRRSNFAGVPAGKPLDVQWDRLSHVLTRVYVAQGRSDRDGILRVPAFVRPGSTVWIRIAAGAGVSDDFELVPGSEGDAVIKQ